MAMIQKIRNQSGLLIGAIGVAMILFMLGGDFLNSSGGGSSEQPNILEIDGEAVSYLEFDARLQEQIKRNYGSSPINEQTRESIRNQMWSLIINEKIMAKEYDKLGLNVTADEIFTQIKTAPGPLLTQYFTNQQTGRVYEQLADANGRLDGEKVLFAIKQMLNSPDGEASWTAIEQALKAERINTKYNNLLKKGLVVTTAEAEANIKEKGSRLTFKYIKRDYSTVADDKVNVTDADLQAYFNAHKHESFYQQKEATRSIEYIIFDVTPSTEDLASLQQEMANISTNFINETEDTLFVNENADTPNNIRYYSAGQLPVAIDSVVFAADSNQVFGPYAEAGSFQVAKLLGSKTTSDSVDARHILIKFEDGDTTKALALADSLKAVIKKSDNFEAMATEFSEDFGSAQDGGKLGWFTEGRMVKEFNDACFAGEEGDMPVVTSQFGVHLIEILEKTEPKEKKLVAIIDRKIEPSKQTFDNAYNESSKFSIENNTADSFRKAGNEKGIRVGDFLRETDKGVAGLDGSRDLVRWAFDNEVGAISEPFEFGNKFIVAHLKEKREKGAASLATASINEKVKAEVLKEKKAEAIAAELAKFKSLDEAASSLGTTVLSAQNVTFNTSSIPGVGTERKLLGSLFKMTKGELSQPIADSRGVYIAVVENITEVAGNDNLAAAKSQLSRNTGARVDYEAYKAIEESCEINDNRAKFF